jgi:hypothetical protein
VTYLSNSHAEPPNIRTATVTVTQGLRSVHPTTTA